MIVLVVVIGFHLNAGRALFSDLAAGPAPFGQKKPG
jgi:hypothetical protein